MTVCLIAFACSKPDNNKETSEEVIEVASEKKKDNVLTAQEKEDGWQLLFDGVNTTGWRSYNEDALSTGWFVEDHCLKSLGEGGDIGGDIVYGTETFENFELYVEWKITEGGNSGIFYHIVEGEKYEVPYLTAPEYQVLDDIGFPDKLEEWQKLGSDYAMYVAPATKAVQKAGTWNSSRIRFTPEKVEYFLNGKQTVSFVPWSADWNERKASGKWKDYPDYGMAKKGFIGLQDHGSEIYYKNMKIRKL